MHVIIRNIRIETHLVCCFGRSLASGPESHDKRMTMF